VIDFETITTTDLRNQKTIITIPEFSNDFEDLCPLSYQLTAQGDFFSPYSKGIALNQTSRGLELEVPLPTADKLLNKTWEFFVRGSNKDDAESFTGRIIVNKQPICNSKIEAMTEERQALFDEEDFETIPDYVSQIYFDEDLDPEEDYFIYTLTDGFPQFSADEFVVTEGQCPLLFPYFISEFEGQSPQIGNWVNYTISENILFASN